MVRELVVPGLDQTDRLLRGVRCRVGETMGCDTHVTIGVLGVEVEGGVGG